MGKAQHVLPKYGQWAVRAEGANHDTALFGRQEDAIKLATRIAAVEQSEVIVHDKDAPPPAAAE
jgi:uncharacterized protein YdaT